MGILFRGAWLNGLDISKFTNILNCTACLSLDTIVDRVSLYTYFMSR